MHRVGARRVLAIEKDSRCLPALAGLVLGLIAMNDTKRSGQSGHSLAVAAVIISSLAIVGYFVYFLVFAMVSGPSTG